MICEKTDEELRRDEVVRATIEKVAKKIEALAGNEVYQRAFKIAAASAREMKP